MDGKAKVGYFGDSVFEEDVGSLDVSVDDAFGVEVVQALVDVSDEGPGLIFGESVFLSDFFCEGSSFAKFGEAVAVL